MLQKVTLKKQNCWVKWQHYYLGSIPTPKGILRNNTVMTCFCCMGTVGFRELESLAKEWYKRILTRSTWIWSFHSYSTARSYVHNSPKFMRRFEKQSLPHPSFFTTAYTLSHHGSISCIYSEIGPGTKQTLWLWNHLLAAHLWLK